MTPFGRDTWNLTPSIRMRVETVIDHEKSVSHKQALKKETVATLCGNVMQRMAPPVCQDELIGAMSCLYFLCKNNIAHITNFEPLLDLTTHLGLHIKDGIRVGKNAHYTSPQSIQELLQAMSWVLETEVLDELRLSECYALMFDETTDISVTEQMVIHCRYINSDGELKVQYLKVIDALGSTVQGSGNEGTVSLNAETVSRCVTGYIKRNNLDYSKLRGIGTDGAAVMIGAKNGAVKKIIDEQIQSQDGDHKCQAIGQHCSAHKLNLAVSQAGDKIPAIKSFKNILRQLFDFYDNSAVRSAGLMQVQNMLNESLGKVKEPCSTRWLSVGKCALRLKSILQSVIVSLGHEAEERGDARAIGLHKLVTNFNFIASLLLMCDVLPVVNRLSEGLQGEKIDFSTVDKCVNVTIVTMNALQETDGECMQGLDDYLAALKSSSIQVIMPKGVPTITAAKELFSQNVKMPLLKSLVQNLNERFVENDVFSAFSNIFNGKQLQLGFTDDHPILCTSADFYGRDSIIMLSNRLGIDPDSALSDWINFVNFTCVDSPVDIERLDILNELCSQQTLKKMFPSLATIAASFRVLPPHTADSERDFSKLKLIKSVLRNRMGEATLDALMRISIAGPALESFNFEKAAQRWSSVKNRRLKRKGIKC